MKEKIIDMDLIQTIEDNFVALYEIKGLLAQMNKPEAPDSFVSFILDFEPFLEKISQNVRLKKYLLRDSTGKPRLCLKNAT